jgi:hypothetical protein
MTEAAAEAEKAAAERAKSEATKAAAARARTSREQREAATPSCLEAAETRRANV